MLKPDYKYGAASVAAEKLVLQALAAEQTADNITKSVSADMQMMTSVNQSDRRRLYQRAFERLKQAAQLKGLMLTEDPEEDHTSEIDALVKLYYALEKAGIIVDNPEDNAEQPHNQ